MSLRATAPPNPPELVRAWRDTGRLTGERIGWCLDRAADQWPARGAVVAGDTTHSFADLRTRAPTPWPGRWWPAGLARATS